MIMNNTILTQKRLNDLENVLFSFGRIASTEEVKRSIGQGLSNPMFKKRLFYLTSRGWFVPLRRGLYYITDLASRGFVGISPYVIASAYNKKSYISMDSALNFYGFFEQMLKETASVTCGASKRYSFQGYTYRFFRIKQELYFGFHKEMVEGQYVNMADIEKAFLDHLYFRSDTYSVEQFIEKIKEAKSRIDIAKLFDYAKKYPLAVKRKLGFILDLLGMDTAALRESVKRRGYSRFTSNSNKFNSKWRIYYEERFVDTASA